MRTVHENYEALLANLDVTEEELVQGFVPVRIINEHGEYLFDGQTERPITAFLESLHRRRGEYPIELTPSERVELIHYATDDLVWHACKWPQTRHRALRALMQTQVRISQTRPVSGVI